MDLTVPLHTGRPADAERPEREGYWAIGVTWDILGSHRGRFRSGVKRVVLPVLAELRRARRIVAVLPLHHRPLQVRKEGSHDRWTDYWLIVLAAQVDPSEVWHAVECSARTALDGRSRLLRAEVLRLQPNLDMYYPTAGREPRWHSIEYVVSRPTSRNVYCRDQYTFSAPFIRRFYQTGAVRRCIGFERVRLLENGGALPEWAAGRGAVRSASLSAAFLRPILRSTSARAIRALAASNSRPLRS